MLVAMEHLEADVGRMVIVVVKTHAIPGAKIPQERGLEAEQRQGRNEHEECISFAFPFN